MDKRGNSQILRLPRASGALLGAEVSNARYRDDCQPVIRTGGTKTACGRERRKDPQEERQCGRKRRSRSRLNSASFARCVSPPSSYLARALVLSFSHSFSLHSEHPSSVSRDEVKHLAGHSQLKLPRYWISLFPANGKPGATTTHSRTRVPRRAMRSRVRGRSGRSRAKTRVERNTEERPDREGR